LLPKQEKNLNSRRTRNNVLTVQNREFCFRYFIYTGCLDKIQLINFQKFLKARVIFCKWICDRKCVAITRRYDEQSLKKFKPRNISKNISYKKRRFQTKVAELNMFARVHRSLVQRWTVKRSWEMTNFEHQLQNNFLCRTSLVAKPLWLDQSPILPEALSTWL